MADDMTLLRKLCYSRAYSLYGAAVFSEKKKRLDWELTMLKSIPDGADAFLQMREFVKTLKTCQKNRNRGISMRYGFRSTAASSLIAYLLEITEMDPEPYYPWTFFTGQKKLYFYINMSVDLYEDMYYWYSNVKIPSFLDIFISVDMSILEMIEKNTGGFYLSDPMDMKNASVYNEDIKKFFKTDSISVSDSRLKYLTDYKKEYVPEVYEVLSLIKKFSHMPSSLQELMVLDGFLHSSFYDKEYGHAKYVKDWITDVICAGKSAWALLDRIYDCMVASPEDVYECLTRCRCPEEKAVVLSGKVQRAKRKLTLDDKFVIENYCGRKYADMVFGIERLYSRSQCMENTIVTAQLMHYINEDYEVFRRAYAQIDDRLKIS